MSDNKDNKGSDEIKSNLHPRNKHKNRYNFDELIETYPRLEKFVSKNRFGDDTIIFSNSKAVKALNTALLKHFYSIEEWNVPDGYLVPPIPGRADYIHNVADLLADKNNGNIPLGSEIKCLDIGVGANCIYPLIGNAEYGWKFLGSEANEESFNHAKELLDNNARLQHNISLRFQKNNNSFFEDIIKDGEFFDISMCNPPFHASEEEANKSSMRKQNKLSSRKVEKSNLNFGGQSNELWHKGGEIRFINDMIFESRRFAKSCFWFTTLVSKESNLKAIYKLLEKMKVAEFKTINMGQGTKKSRIVAWTFLNSSEQKRWAQQFE